MRTVAAELVDDDDEIYEGTEGFVPEIPASPAAPERFRNLKAKRAFESRVPKHPLRVENSHLRRVRRAIDLTTRFFLDSQYSEGYWWAELESNVSITSEYIMLYHLLGGIDAHAQEKMVRYLLNQQRPNGCWGLYHGDQGNLSTTIEAYFALKLAGEDPQSPPMRKARAYILEQGGIEGARVFTKIWLALFGQYEWDKIPSMPVELVLLPTHFHFNIYEFSSWARATIVPLSIVLNIRPKFELPDPKDLRELYLPQRASDSPRGFASYVHRVFYLLDRIAKYLEKHPLPGLRERALRAAETWIIEHQEKTGDWGGIQPPMVYSVLALYLLGYGLDHPVMVKGLEAIEGFCLEDEQGRRMQSCLSPIWDTALNVLALLEGGLPAGHPALQKAGAWLVGKQVLTGGDWQVKNCCPPGGWAFEFVNTQYPDVDDSAVVLNALHRLGSCGQCDVSEALRRGMNWVLSMQSSNGGWAAFDRDNDMMILNRIPFADQEAMVDNASADVTGRVLEAMGQFGYPRTHPRAAAGIQFLKDQQEPDGCWWGRWGVNYIYGTWCAMRGLIGIGEDPRAPYIQAALRWVKEHQNQDGGWGETCESYADPGLRGQGPSTPSQTAWALMTLLAGGEEGSQEVDRGIQYLLNTQKPDGTWNEEYFTGTGFPRHFYIRYHNYRNCFPLMALGQYLRKVSRHGRAERN